MQQPNSAVHNEEKCLQVATLRKAQNSNLHFPFQANTRGKARHPHLPDTAAQR